MAREFDPAEQMNPLLDMPKGATKEAGAEKVRAVRSVASAACPKCSAERVGLVRQGQCLVWRQHRISTWGGASIDCSASGQRMCTLPPRHGELCSGAAASCGHADRRRAP